MCSERIDGYPILSKQVSPFFSGLQVIHGHVVEGCVVVQEPLDRLRVFDMAKLSLQFEHKIVCLLELLEKVLSRAHIVEAGGLRKQHFGAPRDVQKNHCCSIRSSFLGKTKTT